MERYRTLHGVWLLVALAMCWAVPEGHAQRVSPGTTEFEPGSPAYEHLASRGFYRRRAEGRGWFITRREPAFARSNRLGDVLRTAPGVTVVERNGRMLLVSSRSYGECPLAIFSDGIYTSMRSLDELSTADLSALEVYRGPAEIPIAFHIPGYDRRCGALLVWSRIELDEPQ